MNQQPPLVGVGLGLGAGDGGRAVPEALGEAFPD